MFNKAGNHTKQTIGLKVAGVKTALLPSAQTVTAHNLRLSHTNVCLDL